MLRTGILVVGGGPAGLAPLLAASARGLLPDLLSAGLVVAERSDRIGAGRIGGYVINSDSAAETFLSCVVGNPEPELAALAMHPVAQAIAAYGRDAVPLTLIGQFLGIVGEALAIVIERARDGRVMTGQDALWTQRLPDGGWSTRLRCRSSGRLTDIVSRTVLIATGAGQPIERLEQERVCGQTLLAGQAHRLIQSDQALTTDGVGEITRRLSSLPAPRVAVLGGSTSALSCVRVLLEACALPAAGRVTLLHRRQLALFYRSVEEATSGGYLDFGMDDVCPVSGFVFRFGGLRYDSRALAMAAVGLGETPSDPRLILQRLDHPDAARQTLDEADLIVSCVGYRPSGLPVLDITARRVPLLADQSGGALVGPECDVLDAAGEAIDGLFGIGLAAGFRPSGAMGGEPSFRGQVNGLWLWQNDVGALIAARLLAVARRPARVPDPVEPLERTIA